MECKTLSSDEIHVSWQSLPLESLHGTFKGYNVYYFTSDNDTTDSKITTANEIILNGLKQDTFYVINVSVITSIGPSNSIDPVYCKTDIDGILISLDET